MKHHPGVPQAGIGGQADIDPQVGGVGSQSGGASWRGDYHLHSSFSPDSNNTPEQIVERAIAHRLDCIAVTDHNTIAGALEVQRQAPFRVIVGCEVTSRDGHILGLFLHENLMPGRDAQSTVAQIHAQGGIAIAPHPFSRLCGRSLGRALEQNPHLFDAVEVFNSNSFITADNRRALEFARRHGIRAITGSDAHRPRGIGRNIVTMPPFGAPAQFLAALDHAHFDARYHTLPYFAAMALVDLTWRWRMRWDPEFDLKIPPPAPPLRSPLSADEC